ncbi:MAG: adenosine deaminase [Pseudomonadota bacterium]
MADLSKLIADLPKAELHLHLEGTLEPEFMMERAALHKISLPFKNLEEIKAAYNFSNLQDFLDIYYQGMAVLRDESDFYALTEAYLKKCQLDNVKHVEVFFDPQGHTSRGVGFDVAVSGILAALDEAPARFGITAKLIMCFLRHLSEEEAFQTLHQAEPWLGRIAGVGLDSSELGHPPSKFRKVFKAAKERGLHLMAHAGEEGPPDYVRQALELLQIERIDHGNRLLEDEALVAQVKSSGMTMTVCPLSNVALKVVDDLAHHPMPKMLSLGLKATINSDDPAYFGGYVGQNYLETAQATGLTAHDVVSLARNSFTGSFLAPEAIASHLQDIDAVARQHGVS